MKVGFVGLGQMGVGMAGSLLRAGHEVTVYNRTASKADALIEKGARPASDPAAACGGDAVVTMLADDAAVEGVVFGERGILATLGSGAVHVSASTISIELAERLTQAHAEAGQHFVSAPVFGRPQVAAAGELNILVAGDADPVKRVLPLLEAMGQKVWPQGARPRDANLVKICGNFLIFAAVQALGETVALLGKAGVDKQLFMDMMTNSLFASPIYKIYGGMIAQGRYQPPGFAAPLGLKDVRLALAAGDDLQVPLPLGSVLRDQFITLLARGGNDLDASALAMVAAQNSGQQ